MGANDYASAQQEAAFEKVGKSSSRVSFEIRNPVLLEHDAYLRLAPWDGEGEEANDYASAQQEAACEKVRLTWAVCLLMRLLCEAAGAASTAQESFGCAYTHRVRTG